MRKKGNAQLEDWILKEINMELKIQKIGIISLGMDGSDEYLLVRVVDGEATESQLYGEIMPRYYRDCSHHGGYFCSSITIVKQQYSGDDFIVTVHHRYDV